MNLLVWRVSTLMDDGYEHTCSSMFHFFLLIKTWEVFNEQEKIKVKVEASGVA